MPIMLASRFVCVFIVGAMCMFVSATGDLVRAAEATRRSHIQPVGEIAAASSPETLGLRLSRASAVLRQQLALNRGAGLVVDEVMSGSRAERAGFRQHDVLVMLDDQLLLLPEQLEALLDASGPEAGMQCTVLRGGRRVTIAMGAGAAPATEATAGLRPAASAIAIASGASPKPHQPPGRLTRLSNETLLRQDADYQIRLTGGDETRLIVMDNQGRVVFNDSIDTPERRSRMPVSIRTRVEQMERVLETSSGRPAAEVSSLDIAPVQVR